MANEITHRFVSKSCAGTTKVDVATINTWTRIIRNQTRKPVFPAGGGVVEGIAAMYGKMKYNMGIPNMNVRHILRIPSRRLTRG